MKKMKCGYREPQTTTDSIKKYEKERSKLIKRFNKKGQREIDHDKVLEKRAECARDNFEDL